MKIILTILILIGLGAGAWLFLGQTDEAMPVPEERETPIESTAAGNVERIEEEAVPETEVEVVEQYKNETIIGQSVEGRDIVAYHYGNGDEDILFVAGMHGGYAWNTVLMAYQLMNYLEGGPDTIPANTRVTVIPVLNPDGLYKVIGKEGRFSATDVTMTLAETIPGRFNANNVDLNRNFDCEWQQNAVWQDNAVSGGSSVFSEPESVALRDYVLGNPPEAAVFWYSAVGGVFSSNCRTGVLNETRTLTNLYADASGYPAYEEFDFYEITGDAVNWLAKLGIPAISVLQSNHDDVEWQKNKKGIEALLNHLAQDA